MLLGLESKVIQRNLLGYDSRSVGLQIVTQHDASACRGTYHPNHAQGLVNYQHCMNMIEVRLSNLTPCLENRSRISLRCQKQWMIQACRTREVSTTPPTAWMHVWCVAWYDVFNDVMFIFMCILCDVNMPLKYGITCLLFMVSKVIPMCHVHCF